MSQISNQLQKRSLNDHKKDDELEDQINLQKGILQTLEREIKQLETQRKVVDDRNEKHKVYIDELSKMKLTKKKKKNKTRNLISLEERPS